MATSELSIGERLRIRGKVLALRARLFKTKVAIHWNRLRTRFLGWQLRRLRRREIVLESERFLEEDDRDG